MCIYIIVLSKRRSVSFYCASLYILYESDDNGNAARGERRWLAAIFFFTLLSNKFYPKEENTIRMYIYTIVTGRL
jgi:hypothetical protein